MPTRAKPGHPPLILRTEILREKGVGPWHSAHRDPPARGGFFDPVVDRLSAASQPHAKPARVPLEDPCIACSLPPSRSPSPFRSSRLPPSSPIVSPPCVAPNTFAA